MAMRRKQFTTKKSGTDDIVILDVNVGEENEDHFLCNSKIPGMVLVDFISDMDEDDPASMGKALTTFFEASIKKDQIERFMAYTREPENDVEIEDLAEWAGWLAEQYTGGNPTEQSPGSSGGSSQSGSGSTADPSELDWISPPLTANGSSQ